MIESFKLPVITKETVSGSVASFNSEYAELPLDELIVAINAIQSGSGTPSPSNVRPISGWTQANIVRCGVNLWDEEWEVGSYNESTGGKTISVTTTIRNKNPIIVKSGLSYYLSIPSVIRILQYRRDGSYINAISSPDSHIYSPSDEVGYINFRTITAYGTTYNNDISINYPSTDTDYHAYNGNTYTFTFGQSIYQGYIDWDRGVVVGTWSGKVDMGLLNWGYNSSFQAFYISLPNMYIPTTGQERLQGIANEVYPISTVDAISSMDDKSCLRYNGYLWTKDSDYTDRDDFKNSLIGKYVAYELATPIEIPLGGINLLTQEGQNNIFCDTGDTEVKRLKIN